MRRATPPANSTSSFTATLLDILHHPWMLIRLWNWKSAVLSVGLRAPIFLVATIRRGLAATLSAVLTEALFCALSAGFFGSIVQIFRSAQPQWLGLLLITLILPAFFQGIEYAMHWARGTPHLGVAVMVSSVISALSALFNLYAMRRNALLVGPEGRRFLSDLYRLPGLLRAFVTDLPRRWLERNRPTELRIV